MTPIPQQPEHCEHELGICRLYGADPMRCFSRPPCKRIDCYADTRTNSCNATLAVVNAMRESAAKKDNRCDDEWFDAWFGDAIKSLRQHGGEQR